MKKKEILGLDLVDETPDYDKTIKENNEIYKERYKKVYGEYPNFIKEEKD